MKKVQVEREKGKELESKGERVRVESQKVLKAKV